MYCILHTYARGEVVDLLSLSTQHCPISRCRHFSEWPFLSGYYIIASSVKVTNLACHYLIRIINYVSSVVSQIMIITQHACARG
jgi:hypothetical protein